MYLIVFLSYLSSDVIQASDWSAMIAAYIHELIRRVFEIKVIRRIAIHLRL